MRLDIFGTAGQANLCRLMISYEDGEDPNSHVLKVDDKPVQISMRVLCVTPGAVIQADAETYVISEDSRPDIQGPHFLDTDGHASACITAPRKPERDRAAITFYRDMKFDENTPANMIIDFLDDPTCDHPGCRNLYGSDDLAEELKGTAYEGKVSKYVDYTVKEAIQEPRIAVKIGLFGLAVAGVRGTGVREAFRRLRCAYVHALPFDASPKHEVTPINLWGKEERVPCPGEVLPIQDED